MEARQMEEIQRKLALLDYPRASASAQSLLFAGMERYALFEWLFFRYTYLSSSSDLGALIWYISAAYWATSHPSLNKLFKARKRLPAFSIWHRLQSFWALQIL